jgi:hypothetical protein
LCQRRLVLATSYLSLAFAAAAAVGLDAEMRPVEVQFEAPDGCSGASAFFGGLRARSDRVRMALADEPHTTIQVRLIRGHGQVVGELCMIDDRGETERRKVQGATCDEVVQALSLTAAVALDPNAFASVPPVSPAAVSPAASLDADAKTPDARSQSSIDRASKEETAPKAVSPALAPSMWAPRPVPHSEYGVGLVGLTVLSGSFSSGIGVAARKNLGPDGDRTFRPTLGLAMAYLRNDMLPSPGKVETALASMVATVCPLRGTAGILTAQPCAHVLIGWLSARGRQEAHPSTADRFWLSTGLTVRAAAFIGRGFSLELEGGISAPLIKRRFFASMPSNVVAETPTISPIVGVGLTYGR